MVLPVRPQDASGVYRQQVTQAQQAADVTGTRRATGATGSRGNRRLDQVALSSEAQSFARALQSVQSRTDVRPDRVAALREQIAGGRYHVDADAIAARLAEVIQP